MNPTGNAGSNGPKETDRPTKSVSYPDEPQKVWNFTVPEHLGSYRIVREIGRGGMGIVFEGWDETLQRRVALKVLGPWCVGKPNSEARLEAEARSLARLGHSGIVQIYGASREGDLFYLAMEFVEGRDLGEIVAQGPLSAELTMEYGIQIAEALEAARTIASDKVVPLLPEGWKAVPYKEVTLKTGIELVLVELQQAGER